MRRAATPISSSRHYPHPSPKPISNRRSRRSPAVSPRCSMPGGLLSTGCNNPQYAVGWRRHLHLPARRNRLHKRANLAKAADLGLARKTQGDQAPVGAGPLIENLIATLAGFIVAAISSLGLLGIVLMMAIESACVPLPSEIIMPFAGYLVSQGRFSLIMAATAGALGCNLVSAVAYGVVQYGGRPFVDGCGG